MLAIQLPRGSHPTSNVLASKQQLVIVVIFLFCGLGFLLHKTFGDSREIDKSKEICQGRDPGLYVDPTHDAMFYECEGPHDALPVHHKCLNGQYFHTGLQKCYSSSSQQEYRKSSENVRMDVSPTSQSEYRSTRKTVKFEQTKGILLPTGTVSVAPHQFSSTTPLKTTHSTLQPTLSLNPSSSAAIMLPLSSLIPEAVSRSSASNIVDPSSIVQTFTMPEETIPTQQPEIIVPPNANEFCFNRIDGEFAVLGSCDEYFTCTSNVGILRRCPTGLHFNARNSVCDWPINANCSTMDATSRPKTTPNQAAVTTTSRNPSCNQSRCVAPACYCPTTSIPLGLQKNEVPQIVLLTFDDAVTIVVDEFFKEIFNSTRLNPNGCQVTGTFFLSDKNTDYNIIRRLASEGHEIADHSCNHIGHNSPEEWTQEIMCQKNKIESELGSSSSKVVGWRSPYLLMGGDTQFHILQSNGFKYDSSITFSVNGEPLWPFTMDMPYTGQCSIPPCPKGTYPGFFEFPLMNYKDRLGYDCSMFDGCFAAPRTAQETFDLFKSNFHRHYDTNKAPFPAYGHASFFVGRPYRLKGFLQFIDYIMRKDDVYILSIEKTIEWMKKPTKLNNLMNFEPWKC